MLLPLCTCTIAGTVVSLIVHPTNYAAIFFFEPAISTITPLPYDGISIVAPPDCTGRVLNFCSHVVLLKLYGLFHSIVGRIPVPLVFGPTRASFVWSFAVIVLMKKMTSYAPVGSQGVEKQCHLL